MDKKFGRGVLAVAFLSLLMFAPQAAKAATADYSIVVNDAGDALVVMNLAGSGEVNIPLPLDVTNPEVSGALYVPAENGIDVLIGATGKASIAYQTSLLTAKSNGTWVFDMDLPTEISKQVNLLLPPNAEISSTTPRGTIEELSASKKVSWNLNADAEKISVNYVLSGERKPSQPTAINPILLGVLAIVFIGVLAFAYTKSSLFIKPKFEKKTTRQTAISAEKLLISKEKKNVLKTLTENELKIVNNLLENSGSIRRNKLERSTQMAKSSLASALANLERRNIVQVDRTYTVHTVELTDWFRKL